MDPASALLAGLTAGLLIAVQVGPVSLLIVETSVRRGPRTGAAAGLGVATADFTFAAIAAAAGGAAGAALASHETETHVVAAVALAVIALTGLPAALRGDGEAEAHEDPAGAGSARAHYARFLAITIANPLTIASFAAVAAALSLGGPAAAIAFTAGVGTASACWHLALGSAAGHAGRWMTPRARRVMMVGGRLGVLALAAHLAFAS